MMRFFVVVGWVGVALGSGSALAAQQPPGVAAVGRRSSLPAAVRREVESRWNGTNELRAAERLEIGAASDVRGNVAVMNGPLTIAGHVTGDVLAINSDVLLAPGARIDGELLVVGGDVEGRNAAHFGGAIRIYRASLVYRQEGGRITAVDDAEGSHEPLDSAASGQAGRALTDSTGAPIGDDTWWRRFDHRFDGDWNEALRIVQAGAYNRVEGLPIELGPVLQRQTAWGRARVDAAAIIRTGASFSTQRADVGHNLHGEIRVGHERGIGIGGRVFSVIDPVEAWQLSDLETALAAFVAHRDYRDYFQRHGATGSVTLFGTRDLSLSGTFGEERWASREMHNPFTLFNGTREWRTNPMVDDGLFHVGTLALSFDTRTDPDDPWSGWLMNANVEHGRGTITDEAPRSFEVRTFDRGGLNDYTRGFLDVRRYNRLGPKSQLNLRVVVAGWLDGDPLPLERRLSVDGPGALPGFGFRGERSGADIGTCNSGASVPGTPAECDRIALAQIEYRNDLKLSLFGDWPDWPRHFQPQHGDVTWVVFADAGRGWRIGTPDAIGLTYSSGTLPPISSFRTEIGGGLDLGGIGVYAAKSVSAPTEPANFFVRLRHRF